ncbi:MAG: AraC family ligand binding domain-containing protein [Anaerolineae bacterium]|nr:AraC family ligand binding domain-containing protein [Anaerolineae bacterium]
MQLERAGTAEKGWTVGPWNANLAIAIGYANTGIDEPHAHQAQTEIYLVARGSAQIRVEQASFDLSAGDIVVIEPGEAHTFLSSSPDYFHYVIHAPGPTGQVDKVMVSRELLGL